MRLRRVFSCLADTIQCTQSMRATVVVVFLVALAEAQDYALSFDEVLHILASRLPSLVPRMQSIAATFCNAALTSKPVPAANAEASLCKA